MKLDWKENSHVNPHEAIAGDDTECIVVFSECCENANALIRSAIGSCIDKSVELLETNIKDDSMYLLFEWDAIHSILTIVVTNESKECDSSYVVKCGFPALDKEMNLLQEKSTDDWESKVNDFSSTVMYWITDYLTTCPGFLNYSLVAAFHSKSRGACKLL